MNTSEVLLMLREMELTKRRGAFKCPICGIESNKVSQIAAHIEGLETLAKDRGLIMYRLIRALERLSPNNVLTPKARKFLHDRPECSGSILRTGDPVDDLKGESDDRPTPDPHRRTQTDS